MSMQKILGTGKEQSIRITGSTKLSDQEINKMKKEAEEHEEDDIKRKEKVEIRNNGDALAHSAQKTLDELKDKFSEEDKEAIQDALKELRSALSGDDVDKIKEKTDALTQVLQKASTAIYQKAAQQHQQTQGDHQSSSDEEAWSGHPDDDDKTINADYKVNKDEDKKDKKK